MEISRSKDYKLKGNMNSQGRQPIYNELFQKDSVVPIESVTRREIDMQSQEKKHTFQRKINK